jgi:hypothetical protein
VALRDQSQRLRLQATILKNLAQRLKLQDVSLRFLAQRLRLQATALRDLTQRLRLQDVGIRNLPLRLKLILGVSLRNLAGRLRLKATSFRDVSLRLLINNTSLHPRVRDLASRFRLNDSSASVVTLNIPPNSQIGINYYHESMNYISRTTAQITQDLQTIALVTNKIKIYFNPLPQNSGTAPRSGCLAKITSIISIAQSLGFYIVWVENIDQGQVLTDSTTDLTNSAAYKWKWADYCTQVVADAAIAQSLGVNEFLVGNEIQGSTHYYAIDPGTAVATTIYTSGAFPGKVSALVLSCRTNFSGLIGYQEVNSVSGNWVTAGLGNLDKIYFDLYEKWAQFQAKALALSLAFGDKVVLGEVSSVDVFGKIGNYVAYTEDDWSRELMRRYNYCRLRGLTIYLFAYGDPSSTSHGFGLRLNTTDNQSFHDIWNYLLKLKKLTYNQQFFDTFLPNDFTGVSGGTGGSLSVASGTPLAQATAASADHVFRGQIRWNATGAVRLVARYTDANNYYCIHVDITGNKVYVVRRLASVETILGVQVPWPPSGSFSGSFSGSTFTPFDYEIRLQGSGTSTSVEAFFDTYKLCDLVDSGNTSLNGTIVGLLYVSAAANIANAIVSSVGTATGIGRRDLSLRFNLLAKQTKDLSTRFCLSLAYLVQNRDLAQRLVLYSPPQNQQDLSMRFSLIAPFVPLVTNPTHYPRPQYAGTGGMLPLISVPVKTYIINGLLLDTPTVCTTPMTCNGLVVPVSSSFVLLFINPTPRTQALLIDNSTVLMTFLLFSGEQVSGNVLLDVSQIGATWQVVCTTLTTIQVQRWKITSQFP